MVGTLTNGNNTNHSSDKHKTGMVAYSSDKNFIWFKFYDIRQLYFK